DDYKNGIRVTSGDVDGDGVDEIGVSTNKHGVGLVKFFELSGLTAAAITPFNSEQEKGVQATTVKNGDNDIIIAMSSSPTTSNQIGKYIKVDVSEQTLYAYENGALVKSFLVSTGTWTFPTPYDTTTITDKLLWHDYVGFYGEGNPNNYNLPGVKYNLRFRPHHYIHYAYWHNNFGHRMSHGCINVNYENSEWIFNWAEVGTPVEVAP
ncbi:MAG: L,D-transpeptidase, partial [Patescibacteria group bacterium]